MRPAEKPVFLLVYPLFRNYFQKFSEIRASPYLLPADLAYNRVRS